MVKKRIGIDALFAGTPTPAAAPLDASVRLLALDEAAPNPVQPRRRIDDVALERLSDSIKQSGVLQPIIVREREPDRQNRARYQIVAGERRWRAARLAGLTEIPAIVRSISDEEALQIALIENLQREDLNPVEETEGYLSLLKLKLSEDAEFSSFHRANDRDPFGDVLRLLFAMNNQRAAERRSAAAGTKSDSQSRSASAAVKLAPIVETAFASIGRTNWLSFVQHRLPLRKLPADLLEALRQGRVEYTKARALGRLAGKTLNCDERSAAAVRARLLEKAVSEQLSLSVLRRLVEDEISSRAEQSESAKPGSALKTLARRAVLKLRSLDLNKISDKQKREIERKLDELFAAIEQTEGESQ